MATVTPPATRIRFRVAALGTGLAMLTYLDRTAMGTIAPVVTKEWHLTPSETGWIFTAFALAYAIFEIPTAKWAEKLGTKAVLTRIVLWWSVFTAATGAAVNLSSMVIVRFLFGAGEAGAWPMAARAFSAWIPRFERATVQGIFFAGAHLSGGLTPLVVAAIAGWLEWRAIFVVFGLVGMVWAVGWYAWFRDEPREHKSVSAEERDHIEATRGLSTKRDQGSWLAVFKTPTVAPLCVQAFANSYGFYFFITWLPTYLAQAHGMKGAELAIFSGLPLMLRDGTVVVASRAASEELRRLAR